MMPQILFRNDKMVKKIINLSTYLSTVSLIVLVLLIVYDAMMRYLFSYGSTALQELEWHLFDVVILFGIVYTLKKDSHVRVDIFFEKFPYKVQIIIDLVALLFFIIPFSIFIIYVGFDFVTMSFIQNEASSDPGGLPYRWVVKSLILMTFMLVILQAIEKIIYYFNELQK